MSFTVIGKPGDFMTRSGRAIAGILIFAFAGCAPTTGQMARAGQQRRRG